VEELTDNEREEQLRRWWSQNWLWIFGGIALGLAALAGWQYWQNQKLAAREAAAAGYREVIDALGREDRPQAVAAAEKLRKEHPEAPYADQADLALAGIAVQRLEYDEAARLLRGVADASKDAELRKIARTRLARVLIEQNKPDEALALLDVSQSGAFAAIYHDVRGDALTAKGDTAAARAEYESALTFADAESGLDRAFIELKRDSLPGRAVPGAVGQ
jgi:predicted negative regulator of RcsB-dependent stress response